MRREARDGRTEGGIGARSARAVRRVLPRRSARSVSRSCRRQRQEGRWALERTRSTWERCFERIPAKPAELALQTIRDDRDVPMPDLGCEHCGAELIRPAAPRGRLPTYCSERCRKSASVARAAARTSLAA